jgi:two-component system response regulator HydG
LIEDDVAHLASLHKIFDRMGLRVVAASRAQEGLTMLDKHGPFSVALTDLMLPDLDGMELLTALKERQPDLEVVMMTAFGTIERAVEAMRLGAYDFVTKPLRRAEIEKAVRRALERAELIAENRALKAQLAEAQARHGLEALVGHSAPFRNALSVATQAASGEAPILITGESGVGKRALARAVHESSPRAQGPLIELNCAALPSEVLERELFGEEGEAGGALRLAWGGTLILSHVSSLTPRLQERLSHALTTHEGAPSGPKRAPRLISTTDADLSAALEEGELSRGLYHQLSVIPICLPPLRQRLDDILLLAERFLRQHALPRQRHLSGLTADAKQRLITYPWPGNIAELSSVIERAVVLCEGQAVSALDLSLEDQEGAQRAQGAEGGVQMRPQDDLFCTPLGTPLHEVERRLIHRTLAFVGNDKRRAAQLLGITSRTIYRKLAEEPTP